MGQDAASRVDLLVMDPQVDFCKPPGEGRPGGALYVPGAEKDCERLAAMIRRVGSRIDRIHVTLDTHHAFCIFHPVFWVDTDGRHPAPFTTITARDLREGRWDTAVPWYHSRQTMAARFGGAPGQVRDGALEYLEALAAGGRYELTIWPPHCLIGGNGIRVMPSVWNALNEWEHGQPARSVDYIMKGRNPWTEHYSALRAEVVEPDDPGTALNAALLEDLRGADLIAISGEALSHCVAASVSDVADNLGGENTGKLVLVSDTSSPVTGFEKAGMDFVERLAARGMKRVTSTEFLS
jgi:nicotinamidase/pyrazinamidase